MNEIKDKVVRNKLSKIINEVIEMEDNYGIQLNENTIYARKKRDARSDEF